MHVICRHACDLRSGQRCMHVGACCAIVISPNNQQRLPTCDQMRCFCREMPDTQAYTGHILCCVRISRHACYRHLSSAKGTAGCCASRCMYSSSYAMIMLSIQGPEACKEDPPGSSAARHGACSH